MQETVGRLVALLLIIEVATLVVITGIGYLVIRVSMRPPRTVEAAAASIAAGDLSVRVPDADPRTEVGHLAASLNTMLGGIEAEFTDRAASEQAARTSEERMRRFVADASHELGTPLTTIRGFAELFRKSAATGRGDPDRLMRRIQNEATRMGLLIDDLLLRARLDQQRPIARRPVDMLALAGDAVLDAHAVAPDRAIRLEVADVDPPPIVTGDEARLRQVLGNLLANALGHTPTGTPVIVTVGIGIGTHSGAPAVRVTAADQGPGLSDEAASRVFELFYRADATRDRLGGGTGLGLAMVAGLVAGHGGHVDVTSRPGAGACFSCDGVDRDTGPRRGAARDRRGSFKGFFQAEAAANAVTARRGYSRCSASCRVPKRSSRRRDTAHPGPVDDHRFPRARRNRDGHLAVRPRRELVVHHTQIRP